MRLRPGWLLLLCLGCGWPDAPPARVVSHRLGAGSWPENSRAAAVAAFARGDAAVEFDLVLTRDEVPVLSHDPWVNPELCTRADGTKIAPKERLLIRDLSYAELASGFLCGGIPATAHPEAQVVAAPYLRFDELLTLAQGAPSTWLHLDIKYHADFTTTPEAFLGAILPRIAAAAIENPWYMSSPEPEFLEAAAERGVPGRLLNWPRVSPGESVTAAGLSNELRFAFGFNDPLAIGERARATGLNLSYELVDEDLVRRARARGWTTALWTLDTPAAIATFCPWPVDLFITDYPERVSCP